MMREWATVVTWQNGVAILNSEAKTSCNRCAARKGCGSQLLNKLGPKDAYQLQIPVEQTLVSGQRIELGIKESSLLGSAALVYMTPLIFLFVCSALTQWWFATDAAAALGALFGGVLGFVLAHFVAKRQAVRAAMQPIILSIGLPPEQLRVEWGDEASLR